MPIVRISCLCLLSLILTSCGGSNTEEPSPARQSTGASPASGAVTRAAAQAPAAVADLPRGPWTDLAQRLVHATSFETAVTVTREVLARGGIATIDADGPATSPQWTVSPLETLHLAMEARGRVSSGRLSVAELAQMLETFGWTFPGSRAGDRADRLSKGRSADADAFADAERQERTAANAASRARADEIEAQIDREREAGRKRVAEAQQQVTDATEAWQSARLPTAKAPPAEKPAAEARLKQLFEARTAALQRLGEIRKAEAEAERERRTRANRLREEAYALERMRERIGPDFDAGDRLMEALREWTAVAAQDPSNPRSFTPLFLAEMARLQDPPVDLLGSYDERPGRGDGPPVDLRSPYRSALLRFSLLELQLFAAAFLDPTPRTAALVEAPPFTQPDVVRARFVPDPCAQLKKELEQIGKAVGEGLSGPVAGEIGSAAAGTLGGEAMSKIFGKLLSNELGADRAEALGRATAALGVAAKILKLASFYGQGHISVTPEPLRLHKPTGADEMAMFVATAGVDENDLKEFERLRNSGNSSLDRQTSDCLESMGIPKLSDLSDLAEEAEKWFVEWDLVEGMPPHATYYMRENDYDLPGRRAMKMKRHDASSAKANFIIHILPEREHSGKVVRAYVTARASLDAAAAPSIGTFVNAVKGLTGLIDSLAELGAGWLQYMNQPKAYGSIEVEYHCPKPTTRHPGAKSIGDGAGGDGPDDCLIRAGR